MRALALTLIAAAFVLCMNAVVVFAQAPQAPSAGVGEAAHDHSHQGKPKEAHKEEHGDSHGHDHGAKGAHDEKPGEEHEDEEGLVELTAEAEKMAGLQVAPVKKGRISHVIALTGAVAANEDRTVHLNPKVEGLVREVNKTLGDHVAVGEVLVVLDSTQLGTAKVDFLKQLQEFQIAELELERRKVVAENVARLVTMLDKQSSPLDVSARTAKLPMGEYRAKVLLAYSNLRLAKGSYDRQKRLFERKVTSEKEMLEARNGYEGAQAQYRSALDEATYATFSAHISAEKDMRTKSAAFDAALQHLKILGATDEEVHELRNRKARELSHFSVRAPIRGEITEKHVTLGERATPEVSLMTISDRSTVWVLADVYEKDLAHVHAGMPAAIEVNAYPGRIFRGQVSIVTPAVDAKTRTTRLRIVVDNTDGILASGMFAKIETTSGADEAVLSTQASAIQEIEGKTTVFVREKPNHYRAHPVTTGARDSTGERVEIFSGLKQDDSVVVKGAFYLRSEMAKGEMGHDHAH